MPQENSINLSIVIPVFNEELYIEDLFYDLKKYFNYDDIEVIFINDGSYDNSKLILENIKTTKNFNFRLKILNFKKNLGKGKAVREGLKASKGEYLLLQDADLELDVKDSRELYEIIIKDDKIKCIFGSRYLSGKLKKHNYFVNELVGKFNTLLFNIFFGQSLTDIHCGLKIMHKDVYNKINLTINDFGLEIDIVSQIIKSNFFIYEVGVSYFSRTIKAGKKITWMDGLKSYYYLFKVRFIDNPLSTKISILISCAYMIYVGSHFGSGLGNHLFILFFFLMGLIIGLKNKIISSLTIFLFILLGSLFGSGQGKVLAVLLFFVLGIILVSKIKTKLIKKFKFLNSLI